MVTRKKAGDDIFGPFEILDTWPFLGLFGTVKPYQYDKSKRKEALLQSQNTRWVTEALCRTMPEEYPGQHNLEAQNITSNWNSQTGLMVRLFLLSNNFSLSDESFRSELHDMQVSAVVEQITSTGSESLDTFLSTQGFVSEGIKAEIFSWALRHGRDDIVRLLLRLGCDPDPDLTYASQFHAQSLQVAAFIRDKRASVKMIQLLLEYGAKVDNSLVQSALNIATATDNQEAVDILVGAGACLQLPSLAAAIRAGNDDLVRRVLDTGVDINEKIPLAPFLWGIDEWAALPHAAHRGHTHIVKTLVEMGADVDAVYEWSEYRGVGYGSTLKTTALGIAVAAEQVETVRFLAMATREKMEAVAEGVYGCPLAIAALTGNSEIIRMLLDAGADVSHAYEIPEELGFRMGRDKCGWPFSQTLLDLLIKNLKGDEAQLVELCERLLRGGARTDRALVTATMEEETEVVRLLLRHGASLDIPPETMHGSSAFGLAIEMGNLTLARMLHEAGATETGNLHNIKGRDMAEFLHSLGLLDVTLRKYGWMILNKAIEGGEESQWLVDRILDEVDFTGEYGCTLATAVKHTLDIDLIQTMINRGAAWTIWNLFEAIEAAIKADSSDIMCLLLAEWKRVETKNSVGPDELIVLILDSAASHGTIRILGIILAAFDWPPERLGVALNLCISDGNYRIMQTLLDAGASLKGNPWSGSPLDAAICKEQMWLVKILLEAGADVQDHEALLSAVSHGNMGLVELLLSEGANPNGSPPPLSGMLTALQLASSLGFLGIARTLIDAGADINAPGRVGDDPSYQTHGLEQTALTLAALEGRLETLHLLLSRGAAVHGAAREQYVDAVRAAKLNCHGAAAGLLKSYGGWTEDDERECASKHAAAIAATKAHYEKVRSGRDSWDVLPDGMVTIDSTLQDCNLESERDTGGTEMHSEFSDFFFEELARFQGYYSMDGDGWFGSF